MAHDHAETIAANLSITAKNTKASPGTIACVNRAGSVPPVAADLATTATVTTTGTTCTITLSGVADGPTLWQGITFNAGTGAALAGINLGAGGIGAVNTFRNCNFNKLGTGGGAGCITASLGKNALYNCNMQFGNTGDSFGITGGRFEWFGGAVTAGVAPSSLISFGGASTEALIRGVDLSLVTGTLCANMAVSSAHDIRLINCKLGAGVAASAAQVAVAGGRVFLIDCDSGATNYRHERWMCGGTQFTETVIIRTGGASDGTTPISWKIVTDANPRWQTPYESLPISGVERHGRAEDGQPLRLLG